MPLDHDLFEGLGVELGSDQAIVVSLDPRLGVKSALNWVTSVRNGIRQLGIELDWVFD